MQGKTAEAKSALIEAKKLAPNFELEDFDNFLKNTTGNPTGERGALVDRQINSLRDIWPS